MDDIRHGIRLSVKCNAFTIAVLSSRALGVGAGLAVADWAWPVL